MSFLLIVQLVLLVASTVLTAILAKRNEQQPSALGAFTEPTAEEGRIDPRGFRNSADQGRQRHLVR